MKIDRVYISNYKGDVRFLRPCVASIRAWYPDIPISIIQDLYGGAYSLTEECAAWNLDVYDTSVKRFGSGWARLEPLFHTPPERFLYLDADIVFSGPVIDELEQFDEDLVLTAQESRRDQIERYWFDLSKLAKFDPDFEFRGSAYNVGLFVANAGLMSADIFRPILEFSEPRRSLYPDMLLVHDSGPVNYVFLKQEQQGKLTIGVSDIMRFCPSVRMPTVLLASLARKIVLPYALHWAGASKNRPFGLLHNGHILQYFDDMYHKRVPRGKIKQAWRNGREKVRWFAKRIKRKLGFDAG